MSIIGAILKRGSIFFMLITIISLILATLLLFFPFSALIDLHTSQLPFLIALAGTAILIVYPLLNGIYLLPLQRLEEKLIPRLIELYRKDRWLNISRFLIFLFPFFSYLLAGALWGLDIPIKSIILAIWIVAFGIVLDLIRDSLSRTSRFLNPYNFVDTFVNKAKRSIIVDKDSDLWGSIDTLSEIAIRSIKKGKMDLSMQVLNAFPPILDVFFVSSKSITRINQDQEIKKETGRDEASYTVFYLLQRIELINMKALENGLVSICSHIIMILGKIIAACAKFDLSMVAFPTHVMGKLALKALQYQFNEVAALGTSTLLELAKTIINEIDLSYAELQDPFNAIINNLNYIGQATFKKDKSINPKLIAQPFRELKELFQNKKVESLQDTPIILQHIDSVLAEYDILAQVMRTIPSITEEISKEK